ncbi:hypothetical protein PRK78_006303 [Emydomyces testavorans]|uniref:Helicase C-terminal domain-containing protein n=1 Tax=Emydomyces testavorans TaxID=2070801 RepID=A0AAF0DPZ4_9EURO|nr:hypothetical protein PRK78_006303 [Emydomyces testavorans]
MKDSSFLLQLESVIGEATANGDSEEFTSHISGAQSISSGPSTPVSLTSTPSSQSSFVSPPSRPVPEKALFLDNIDNFIPVGILKQLNSQLQPCDHETIGENTEYPAEEVNSLERAGWIRTSICKNEAHPGWNAIRVYALPEDIGQTIVPRSSAGLHRALKTIMSKLDPSPEAWIGQFDPFSEHISEQKAEDESLFYIFNTLESPNPNVDIVSDPWARIAMEEVLAEDAGNSTSSHKNNRLPGLKTTLYPYQRRSAALMIQKESEPGELEDPRFQPFNGPTGQRYYYDKEEGTIYRDKRLYSGACGGVLAETMGYGKTLICLAVILATKGHFPRIPCGYLQDLHPVRAKTASLLEMAASTAGRYSVPWKFHFDRMGAFGIHHEKCVDACEQNRGSYTIIQTPKYGCRKTTSSQVKRTHLRISSGTLVIVPPNLVDHWIHEIERHTQGLNVLVLRDISHKTPSADELLQYDIILFSRVRFEKENGEFGTGSSKIYNSPLKEFHWLRIIVDEGHNFASTSGKTNATHLLERLHVERRWVVSGTPSDGMYGVEVSLASQETFPETIAKSDERAVAILKARKDASSIVDEELKNLDKLRRIVVDFLCLKPWANCRSNDAANWTRYIKPRGADGKRKMAASLRSTLQSIVVRHRSEDISKDLTLPSLHNKVVYLEPTFHDKLSLNMFVFQLAVNAITSERTDQDYMFHPRNRKHLGVLINNLRHAGFWWTGFEKNDVEGTLEIARKYLERNRDSMNEADLSLLCEGISIAERTIACSSWNAFSQFDELGVLVSDFPEHARGIWSIDGSNEHQQPLLLGISQARDAQRFITAHLCSVDPSEGLAGAGIKTKREMQRRINGTDDAKSRTLSPTKSQAECAASNAKTNDYLIHRPKPETPSKKQAFSSFKVLPTESPLAKTRIVATASAKLTYLLDRVLEFQDTEKIIIFYENNNTAFWIAEGLEMLGVEFRMYASGLKAHLKSEYLSVFNDAEAVRVLLMDLRQASHGLHMACASRIFIVNPIWDPNIESQAIKRAHRISQSKPVYVETLVLKDTLEDKMLRRRKQMSNAEMQHAEKDLLEDRTMSYIIQTEGFIPISGDEKDGGSAYLKNMPGFFDRHKLPIRDNHKGKKMSHSPRRMKPRPVRRTPAKQRGNKDFNTLPFLDSDVSPGAVKINQRRKALEETVTEDGIVMLAGNTPTPRKRRATSRLADANADHNPSNSNNDALPWILDSQAGSPVPGNGNLPEDPFYTPGLSTASAPFFFSSPVN